MVEGVAVACQGAPELLITHASCACAECLPLLSAVCMCVDVCVSYVAKRSASQDAWAAHHARLLTQLEDYLSDIALAEAESKAASAAAEATLSALHARERQQLQQQQGELQLTVQQLEAKVEQLEQDGVLQQQQQEELTSMCAQVGGRVGWSGDVGMRCVAFCAEQT